MGFFITLQDQGVWRVTFWKVFDDVDKCVTIIFNSVENTIFLQGEQFLPPARQFSFSAPIIAAFKQHGFQFSIVAHVRAEIVARRAEVKNFDVYAQTRIARWRAEVAAVSAQVEGNMYTCSGSVVTTA